MGGRGGWRLPAFNELSSLVDPTVQNVGVPQLPPGHPFQQVQPVSYWSDTQFADEPGFALVIDFQFNAATAGQVRVNDANTAGGFTVFGQYAEAPQARTVINEVYSENKVSFACKASLSRIISCTISARRGSPDFRVAIWRASSSNAFTDSDTTYRKPAGRNFF